MRAWGRLHLLTVMAVPLLVTAPRFLNGLVFDDVFVIARGDFIHHARNLPAAFTSRAMIASSLNGAIGDVKLDTYRPLSIASFFWDAWISGRAPWSYQLTSAVLHALCTALVRVLLVRLVPGLTAVRATVLACLFGLSPWLCEAHVFINGRSDLLLGLCALIALCVHQRALASGGSGRAWLTGLCVLAGLLAKETMVMVLPLVCLVPVPEREVSMRRRLRAALPLALAFVTYMLMRLAALKGLHVQTDAARTRDALGNLPMLWLDTLARSLFPTPYVLRSLRDDYASAPTWQRAGAWLVLMATAILLGYALRRGKWLAAWAVSLAFLTAAPAVMITTELWQGFGRYLYLPAIGIVTLLAVGLQALDARIAQGDVAPWIAQRVRWAPAALIVVSALCTLDATCGYRDERTLYSRALAQRPDQAWTYGFLGLALRKEGRCAEAIPLLARADRMAPEEPRYALHLARCWLETGARDQAREVARSGQARFRDTRAEAGFLLAEFLTLVHGDPHAEQLMSRCLRLVPDRTDCAEGLALARSAVTAPGTP